MYLAVLIFIGSVIVAAHVAYWAVLIFGTSKIMDDLRGKQRNTTIEPTYSTEYERLVAKGKDWRS
jgi:hypothetical protein